MPVTKSPEMFKASDGRTFTDKTEAEGYDALLIARADFANARRALGLAAGKCCRTADGKLFDFRSFRDYWRIEKWSEIGPEIKTCSFGYWTEVELNEDDTNDVRLIETIANRRFSVGIGELYADRGSAWKAFEEAVQERIDSLKKGIEKP